MSRARRQYEIYQFNVKDLKKNKFEIDIDESFEDRKIKLGENQACDLILKLQKRKYIDNEINFIPGLFFLVATNKDNINDVVKILSEGVKIDNKKYVRFGKSASMARNGRTAFIQEDLYKKLKILVSVNKLRKIEEDIISKLESYLGLCFSTTMFIDTVPKNICIVDEDKYNKTINEYIKTLKDNEVIEGNFDVDITLNDGMGVHTPQWGKKVSKELDLSYIPVGYQIRLLPFTKGMTFEFDFKQFYKERDINQLTDIWGKVWEVEELDCIWSSSLFKGSKHFKSMEEYMQLRDKFYNPPQLNKIGISRWSKPTNKADIMSKITYQYLQNLSLSGREVIDIAEYTKDIVEKVYKGNSMYAQIFLGLLAHESDSDEKTEENLEDRIMASKVYHAVSCNPDVMLKDPYIKSFLKRQLKKTIDEMKLGRLYINGRNSFITQDPVMFLEIAANLEPKGCLGKSEFYSSSINGDIAGFRSPLIHSSEVRKMNFISNNLTEKWLSRYDNIIVFNAYDLTAQSMGGADFDGDTIFWTQDERIVNSVIEEYKIYKLDEATKDDEEKKYIEIVKKNPPVIDINDKAKAKPVKINSKNLIEYDLRTLDSRIGGITNQATYWTTKGSANGNVNKYDKELVILRMAQGSEIDFVKTGIRTVEIPESVSKYAKKYKPYFLQKYKYGKSNSIMSFVEKATMNILCNHIELWEKKNFVWDKWESKDIDVTGNYLMNKDLLKVNEEEVRLILPKIEKIYKDFNEEFSKLYLKKEVSDATWNYFFEKYYFRVNKLSDKKEILSSLTIYLTYKKYKKDNLTKSFIFPWCCTWEGIALTLDKKRGSVRVMPQKIDNKFEFNEEELFEFLGKQYVNRFVVMNINTPKFIKEQIEKQNEKSRDNFEYETFIAALQGKTGQEVSDLLKDNIVTLKPSIYKEHEYVALYINDEYLGSLGKLEDFKIEDGIIDLKVYYNRKFKVEPIKIYKKSLKAKLSLVS